tara:strand:+ start:12893 stop:13216 length:324 start_codon:yes stop_codon:yes gene_type:complete
MIVTPETLPRKGDSEQTIFLSKFTLRRKYKKTKNSKQWTIEEMVLRESLIHKGISPSVIIRRRGMLKRLRDKSGWAKGIISIIKIDFEIHLRDGCEEPLENIEEINK